MRDFGEVLGIEFGEGEEGIKNCSAQAERSFVESKKWGSKHKNVCYNESKISQFDIVADTVYLCGPSASFADGSFIFDRGRLILNWQPVTTGVTTH